MTHYPSHSADVVLKTPSSGKCLSFYAYDFLENPWCGGGGAYRDFEIAIQQADHWKQITFYVGKFPGLKQKKLQGICIKPLGIGSLGYLISRISYTFMANVHVIANSHSVIGNTISIYAPLFSGFFFPRKFYAVIHHLVEKQSIKKFGLIGWLPYIFEKIILRFVKNVIVINHAVAHKISILNPNANICISANGFNDRLLALQPKSANHPFILFIGRFDIYMKGLDLLVSAYAQCVKHHKQMPDLILAGRTSSKNLSKLQQYIQEAGISQRIKIFTNITEEIKYKLLETCLFFCSPSRFEGWGIAALEANAAGKAVLVSETEGFTDSIKRDYSGFFVPVNDIQALEKALYNLCTNTLLRNQLEKNAKQWAQQFTWKEISSKEYSWLKSSIDLQ